MLNRISVKGTVIPLMYFGIKIHLCHIAAIAQYYSKSTKRVHAYKSTKWSSSCKSHFLGTFLHTLNKLLLTICVVYKSVTFVIKLCFISHWWFETWTFPLDPVSSLRCEEQKHDCICKTLCWIANTLHWTCKVYCTQENIVSLHIRFKNAIKIYYKTMSAQRKEWSCRWATSLHHSSSMF